MKHIARFLAFETVAVGFMWCVGYFLFGRFGGRGLELSLRLPVGIVSLVGYGYFQGMAIQEVRRGRSGAPAK